MKFLIDHTVFLGTHSENKKIRIACKNFFCNALNGYQILMPLNEVGICDKLIWQNEYTIQELYYPYMDYLHTLINFDYFDYSESNIREALTLSIRDKIYDSLFSISAKDCIQISFNKNRCEDSAAAFVNKFNLGQELNFPKRLELFYQKSLVYKYSP